MELTPEQKQSLQQSVTDINANVAKVNAERGGNLTQLTVPTIQQTPVVISSKDKAAGFSSNSSALDGKVPPPLVPPGTPTDPAAQEKPKTPLEQSMSGKPMADGQSTSGNPIFDAIEAERLKNKTQTEADAAEQKKAQMQLLNTSLAAVDSTYSATLANIENTYNASFAVQTRINNMNVGRTKAYGLANGNALGAPQEFTNAVSLREQEAASEISKLDNQRLAAIATARAARDSGDAKLLEANMNSIRQIETEMRQHLADIATEATNRFNLLTKLNEEQQAKQKEKAAALLAEQVLGSVDAFGKEKDVKKQDEMVKSIVAKSGGLLSYSDVLTSMQGEIAKRTKATQDTEEHNSKMLTDQADRAYKSAQTNKTWQEVANLKAGKNADGSIPEGGTTGSWATINKLMVPGVKMDDGTPYLAPDGKLTAKAFDAISKEAAVDKIGRDKLLEQIGSRLQPGPNNDYSQYELTGAEKKKLTGVAPLP